MKTSPRSLVALLGVVLVAALVGSSCSAVTPQALTVGGWTLSERDFLDQLQSVADNQAFLDAQGGGADLTGTTADTFNTAFTSGFLQERLTFVLAAQENERRGIEVTDDDRRNAEVLLSLQFGGGGGQGGASTADPEGLAVLDGFSSAYRDALVDGVANVLVLRRDILDRAATDEGLRALFDARSGEIGDQACASHILIQAGSDGAEPTEADFAAALDEIEAVEDELQGTANFAALATEHSDDPGSATRGGELGCESQGAYVEAFDEAVWTQPIGQVGPPVRTEFGYHLVLVTKRGPVQFEDVKPQLAQAVEQNSDALLSDWLRTAASEADVSVNPKFGRWDALRGQIVPPEGAETGASGPSEADLAELLGSLQSEG